jgi:hypothetical protein
LGWKTGDDVDDNDEKFTLSQFYVVTNIPYRTLKKYFCDDTSKHRVLGTTLGKNPLLSTRYQGFVRNVSPESQSRSVSPLADFTQGRHNNLQGKTRRRPKDNNQKKQHHCEAAVLPASNIRERPKQALLMKYRSMWPHQENVWRTHTPLHHWWRRDQHVVRRRQ